MVRGSHIRSQPKAGVDGGPIHLVEAGLPQQLTELGWKVQFDGHHQFEDINTKDDPPIGKLKNPRLVSRVCKAVADVVADHAKKGQLPLTLGGDHSLVSLRPNSPPQRMLYPASPLGFALRPFSDRRARGKNNHGQLFRAATQGGCGCTRLGPRTSSRCSLPAKRLTRSVAATSGRERLCVFSDGGLSI